MRERDMDRSELGQLPGQDSEKACGFLLYKIPITFCCEKKALKSELLAKDKIIEDLSFRLEEETISKDFQIEELQKKLTTVSTESAPPFSEESLDDSSLEKRIEADHKRRDLEAKCAELEGELKNISLQQVETSALTAEIADLKTKLEAAEGEKENFKRSFEAGKAANSKIQEELESLREELISAKEQASNDRFTFEEQLTAVNDLLDDKTKKLEMAETLARSAEKDLENVRVELQSAQKEIENQKKVMESLTANQGSAEAALTERVDAMAKELQEKDKSILAVEQDKKTLEEALQINADELQQLKDVLANLEKEKGAAQETLNRLNEEKAAVEQRLIEEQNGIQKSLAEFTEKINAINAAKESVEASLNIEKAQKEELQKEKEALDAQMVMLRDNSDSAAKEIAGRCAQLEVRIKEAESQVSEERAAVLTKEEELTSLKKQLEKNDSEYKAKLDAVAAEHVGIVEKLNSSLQEAESKYQALEQKCAGFEVKVADLDKALMEEREKSSNMDKELREKMVAETTKWRTAEEAYIEKLEQSRLLIEVAASEKRDLEQAKEKSESEIKQKTEELNSLTEKLQNLTMERDKVAQSKAEVEEQLRQQKEAFSNLQSTINASKLGEDAMAKELSSAQEISAERLAEVNRLQNLVQSLEEKYQIADSASADLSYKLVAAENHAKKIEEERNATIKELQQSLVQETTMRTKVEKDLRLKSDEVSSLQNNIDSLTVKSAEMENALDKLKLELTAKLTELDDVRKEKDKADVEKQTAESQVSTLTLQLQEMEKKIAASNQTLEEQAKQRISDYEAQTVKLNGDLVAATHKQNELTRELALNVEDLSRTKAELNKSTNESVFSYFFSRLR
ncbi:unnamed protein product [Strongylus vulgaris]|uniref:Uncharacterized protein n=1 Tax=Strongylus vulgaris TaxID=40348 RepID=A0A3P7J8H1_STRVU|nr:unnamed protein product [Strongylus vulgaris]